MRRLTPDMAHEILARHDLVGGDEAVEVAPLSGGVSSVVLLVATPRQRYVLKQPRAEFATEAQWRVDTGRAKVEYEVGRFLAAHLGRRVVPLLAYDEGDDILIMKAAPRGWQTWKERMLHGEVRPATGKAAGRLLAGIHALGAELDDPEEHRHDALFHEQRVDPYFQTAARHEPGLKERLEALTRRFFERADLVHGDFSPKNLFVDPAMEEVRLIDHEVATRGDAAFDVGFCLTHLVMKGIHMPQHRDVLHETAQVFLDTYQDARPDDEVDPVYAREERAVAWLGACLLARAIGKSRVEYLSPDRLEGLHALGLRLTERPVERLDAALEAARAVP